jgi:predicted ATPase with chaperone activity
MNDYSAGIAGQPRDLFTPPEPKTIQDCGLDMAFLSDLVLKVLYFQGSRTGTDISETIKLPFQGIIDEVMTFLKREQMIEIKGGAGLSRASYEYAITDRGGVRAREVLNRNQYIGPAPVPLQAYNTAIRRQTTHKMHVNPQTIRQALSHLVLNDRVFDQVGPAVNSGRSIFLFGPPGNGKTSIAESIGRLMLNNDIVIPYCVSVDGQIVKVFDDLNHVRSESDGKESGTQPERRDQRWVQIHRPVVTVGGELTMESLDLIFDDSSLFYEAPFQMKANGGMFLIDDFGRQQIRPRDLLNRWIVPLEKRLDFLTLRTGRQVEVPFEVLIVFSTNLEPRDLVDEAFLRRIRYKVEIGDPSFDEYRTIFQRVCRSRKVAHSDEGLSYLLQEYYIKPHANLRACHPRDIIDELLDIAIYMELEPKLTPQLIDLACEAYFVDI